MVVGVLKVNLILSGNHSLKGKRGVVRSIQARISRRFNISVTECGDQDLWQSAILGFGLVGSSRQVVEATLQKVIGFIDHLGLAQVAATEVEFYYC